MSKLMLNKPTRMKMNKFNTVTIQKGSRYNIYQEKDISIHTKLPVGTYTIKFDKVVNQFYLEMIDDFKLPDRIYGSKHHHSCDRIIETFIDRTISTGVLLNGVKGAGKTLLAKQISVAGAKCGFPTIIVSDDHCGNEFNTFVQSINTPAIMIFDEFEKTYQWAKQDKLLTLFDGVFFTKKLFILTTNRSNDVSSMLRNRPSRMYYSINFSTIEIDSAEEYCNDVLENKDHIKDIINYINIFPYFNFDMLASVVEEMNRFGEPFDKAIALLNIEPEISRRATYQVYMMIGEHKLMLNKSYKNFNPNEFSYNLWVEDFPKSLQEQKEVMALIRRMFKHINYSSNGMSGKVPDNDDDEMVTINNGHLRSFDPDDGKFTYTLTSPEDELNLIVKRNADSTPWYNKYDPALRV